MSKGNDGMWAEENRELRQRIEELSRAIGVWEKIVRDKDKRIEELEDVKFALLDQVSALSGEEDFHILTTAQIDAAWRVTVDPNISENALMNVEAALKELGIVRCEGCGGRGIIQHLETPLEPDDDYGWNQKCPSRLQRPRMGEG
jgi:hypothetical protein